MAKDTEALYRQLGALLASAPEVHVIAGNPDGAQWLGRCRAVMVAAFLQHEVMALDLATGRLSSPIDQSRASAAADITMILYRALGVLEMRAPSAAQGAFIPVGNSFDAFASIGKILQSATEAILFVDPYMDDQVLTDFAILAPENVHIGVLTDASGVRASLEPSARRWVEQYGDRRRLRVRLSPARTLHDRAILVDRDKAWVLTQSLKDFAARSPATIQQVDHELALMKFDAYNRIWEQSTPLVAD
jgi:hypothetical protein